MRAALGGVVVERALQITMGSNLEGPPEDTARRGRLLGGVSSELVPPGSRWPLGSAAQSGACRPIRAGSDPNDILGCRSCLLSRAPRMPDLGALRKL